MELKVQERSGLGKKVKKIRAGGNVPAEVYGKGIREKDLAVGAGPRALKVPPSFAIKPTARLLFPSQSANGPQVPI